MRSLKMRWAEAEDAVCEEGNDAVVASGKAARILQFYGLLLYDARQPQYHFALQNWSEWRMKRKKNSRITVIAQ